MGKSSGKAPTNQTQTVTSVPYLSSYVQDAAKAAQGLYRGNGTQGSTTTTSPASTSTQGYNPALQAEYSNLKYALETNPQSGAGGDYQRARLAALESQLGVVNGQYTAPSTTSTTSGAVDTDGDGWPDFYPDQTYVDYSPETLSALDQITQRANAGSPLNAAANTNALDTINGKYLEGNPYIDNIINTSLNDVTKKYTDQVLPGLASNFAQSGRYGSGIQQNLTSDAIGQLGKEAMGVAGGIRYDNYNNERTRQLQATALAPTLSANDYYDAQQLLGVGSAREALSQAKLQDSMDRFNFYENQAANMLDQYIARIGALNSGGGTQTTTGTGGTQGSSTNKGLSALSGAATGLGLANTAGLAMTGPWGIGLGIGGALLGGLFN